MGFILELNYINGQSNPVSSAKEKGRRTDKESTM